MSKINFVKGNALEPVSSGNIMIPHVCNDLGGWGRGFVMAISKKWKEPEKYYRQWCKGRGQDQIIPFKLGMTQFVPVEDNIVIANMLAQKGYSKPSMPAIRYDSLIKCITTVGMKTLELDATIHLPDMIGCGLAGGDRKLVLKILEQVSNLFAIDIFVYNFEK